MYLVSGKALFDCFVNGESGPDEAHIHAVAGGTPFNVVRGIARLGGKAAFFGGVSTDLLGRKSRRLLESEGVDTEYVVDVAASTPLSVVGTGPAGSPSCVFYNRGTAECSLTYREITVIDERTTGLHIVTDGANPVRAFRQDESVEYEPPGIAVADTVGAGDTFQAALLTRIAEFGPPADVVSELGGSALRETLEFAAAAVTCRRRGAGLPARSDLDP